MTNGRYQPKWQPHLHLLDNWWASVDCVITGLSNPSYWPTASGGGADKGKWTSFSFEEDIFPKAGETVYKFNLFKLENSSNKFKYWYLEYTNNVLNSGNDYDSQFM